MTGERVTLQSLATEFRLHAAQDIDTFVAMGKRLGRIEGAAWASATAAISLLLAVLAFLVVRYVLPPERVVLEPDGQVYTTPLKQAQSAGPTLDRSR